MKHLENGEMRLLPILIATGYWSIIVHQNFEDASFLCSKVQSTIKQTTITVESTK